MSHLTAMRVNHNSGRANNMLVCIDTLTTASNHIDACAAWLARTVNTLHPVSAGTMPHSVAIGPWLCDDATSGRACNRLLAVVHAHDDKFAPDCIDERLVVHNATHDVHLDAAAIAKALQCDPRPFATAIGVSAVPKHHAADVWGEIVTTNRQWMHGSGDGFARHPQWQWDANDGMWDCREKSAEYQWH